MHPGICSLWLLPPDYEFHLAVGGRLLGIISKREVWRWRASTRLCLLEKVRRSPPLGPHVYSIELNYCYLVERKRLGLGVQFWTSSSDVGLWASRRRAALWELKSPGRCLALRRRSEGQAGDYKPQETFALPPRSGGCLGGGFLAAAVIFLGCLLWVLGAQVKTAESPPFPWIPRKFKKTLSQTQLSRLTLGASLVAQ